MEFKGIKVSKTKIEARMQVWSLGKYEKA